MTKDTTKEAAAVAKGLLFDDYYANPIPTTSATGPGQKFVAFELLSQ